MGKITGFLEVERKESGKRAAEARMKDWQEIQPLPEKDHVTEQASRCMNCGTPFCHTGIQINGLTSGCPIHNKIPDFNDLVYSQDWKEAFEVLSETNNFPEFTGKVCPAPCEGSCVLGINQPPVTIKEIELSIIETAFANGWVPPSSPTQYDGERVAVVGSGPAGLACAEQLNKMGHRVTVFERSDKAGGLLMYGIPNMKLDKALVQRRIDLMIQSGIEFRLNIEIGKDLSADTLSQDFQSVIFCCGASRPRDLPIEGRSLQGIHFAMDYLTASTKHLLDGDPLPAGLSAQGKKVLVLGGGDTGTDCVATSLRQQCKDLRQIEILDRPPDERGEDNPWPEWPKKYFLDYGQQEAKAKYGEDPRLYQTLTKRFIGNIEGNLAAVEMVKIEWSKTDEGKWQFNEIPDSGFTVETDLVLLALGYVGSEEITFNNTKLEFGGSGDMERSIFHTNVDGVFAAGDMRRGQSLVVWAIYEGREAAEACNAYLRSKS